MNKPSKCSSDKPSVFYKLYWRILGWSISCCINESEHQYDRNGYTFVHCKHCKTNPNGVRI